MVLEFVCHQNHLFTYTLINFSKQQALTDQNRADGKHPLGGQI